MGRGRSVSENEPEPKIREGASEGGCRLTPEAFGARLRRQPPARLELPDGVELSGASLAAFLESAHFPFGQYQVCEERFFVTPSLRLGMATLEALVRSGRGERAVGRELLVWQPASFRVAAGTASRAAAGRGGAAAGRGSWRRGALAAGGDAQPGGGRAGAGGGREALAGAGPAGGGSRRLSHGAGARERGGGAGALAAG